MLANGVYWFVLSTAIRHGASCMILTVFSASGIANAHSGISSCVIFSEFIPWRITSTSLSFASPWYTINFHGCRFLADGARVALYMISSISFLSISSDLYFLILLLFSISRIIVFSVNFDFNVFSSQYISDHRTSCTTYFLSNPPHSASAVTPVSFLFDVNK